MVHLGPEDDILFDDSKSTAFLALRVRDNGQKSLQNLLQIVNDGLAKFDQDPYYEVAFLYVL